MEEKPIPAPRLKERLIGKPSTPDLFKDIEAAIEGKRSQALADWAKRKMGRDYYRYMLGPMKRFLVRTLLHVVQTKCDPVKADRETPFEAIPLRRSKGTIGVDPYRLLKDYEACLAIVGRTKKRTYSSQGARIQDIIDNLPGIKGQMAAKLDRMPEASNAALEYVRWKYKLSIGIEAVKKQTGRARREKKLLKGILKLMRMEKEQTDEIVKKIQAIK